MIAPSIFDVLDDPALLAPFFTGPSWATWRAVLLAAYGLPLSPDDLALFHTVAGDRAPPAEQVRELIAVAGRKAGKDSIAAAIATAAALRDYTSLLRPGERATIFCVAVARDQAAIALNYIRGHFADVPLLDAMVERETADGLLLNNKVEIVVGTNDHKSIRGRTVVCAIFDECAFYGDENSASSDYEMFNAVLPSLATVPGGMLVLISTPWKRSGLLYDRWAKYFGKDDPSILVVHGASRTFHPTLDPRIINEHLERDPEFARAEWLAQWRDDLSTFIGRELLEAAVDRGVMVRPPAARIEYIAFADPSGGAHDAFTLAIAHAEGEATILDLLYERKPPFAPSEVVEEIAALLRTYRLRELQGDRYAAQWTVEAFAKVSIDYRHSERDRSAIYLDALPLFTSGRARLIDNDRLVAQFAALERRTFSTGRDRVDHGRSGHDDLCNSAAGALVLASASDGASDWAKLGAQARAEGMLDRRYRHRR